MIIDIPEFWFFVINYLSPDGRDSALLVLPSLRTVFIFVDNNIIIIPGYNTNIGRYVVVFILE